MTLTPLNQSEPRHVNKMQCPFVLVWLFLAPVASANDIESQLQIQRQLAALTSRVEVLERENTELKRRLDIEAPVTEAPVCLTDASMQNHIPNSVEETNAQTPRSLSNSVEDRFRIDGDFRLRYEEIDVEGTKLHQRARIRARASIMTDITDTVEVGIGVSTGGSSPISSTQTLGNGGSKKDLALDLAYVDWQPIEGLHVLAGKFRNPLFQLPSETLLWDDEWRPEGIGLDYQSDSYFASLLGTSLESDSLAPQREWTLGGHAGFHHAIGNNKFMVGLGYFDVGTAGKGTFYGDDLAFAGNSYHCVNLQDSSSCSYIYDYRELEMFATLDFSIGDVASKVYGHVVRNLDADQFDTGWTAGVRLLTAVQGHALQLDYFYRDLEKDAVYGQLTNSDFGGGGTGVKGHYIKPTWRISSQWALSATYFSNQFTPYGEVANDFDRIQLDIDYMY